MVTSGCAAALCQVTAACVAGLEPDKMKRLPDTSGMKNRVITQPSHRHVYDHAIRMVGVQIVEVETPGELEAAVDESTAMIAIFGDAADRGTITVPEIVRIARNHDVPTFVDAAAERPDVPNPYLSDGVDVVAYSGGKCLRGPQASGMVLGRKDILHAAFMNGAPASFARASHESGERRSDGTARRGGAVGAAGPRRGMEGMGAPARYHRRRDRGYPDPDNGHSPARPV